MEKYEFVVRFFHDYGVTHTSVTSDELKDSKSAVGFATGYVMNIFLKNENYYKIEYEIYEIFEEGDRKPGRVLAEFSLTRPRE